MSATTTETRCFAANDKWVIARRLIIIGIMCLGSVLVDSLVFDYYRSCGKNDWAIMCGSLFTAVFGFTVQVVMCYRLLLDEVLSRKFAAVLLVLCCSPFAALSAVRYIVNMEENIQHRLNTARAMVNDIVSLLVVPGICCYKVGIRGFLRYDRCARKLLLIVTIAITIVIDVLKFEIKQIGPYGWKGATLRSPIIFIVVCIYCHRNRKEDRALSLNNPTILIEVATFYNLLQSVLDGLSYILNDILKNKEQFQISIIGSQSWGMIIAILALYTIPMVCVTSVAEQLIELHENIATKQLLIFPFTFFEAYITTILTISVIDFNYSLFGFFISFVVLRVFIIYWKLTGVIQRVVLCISKCISKCISRMLLSLSRCRRFDNGSPSSDKRLIDNDDNTINLLGKKTGQPVCNFFLKREHVSLETTSKALDIVLQQLGALACYIIASTNFFVVHFVHPINASPPKYPADSYWSRGCICLLCLLAEIIIIVTFFLFLRKLNIKPNELLERLRSLTSWGYLICFALVITLYCLRLDIILC